MAYELAESWAADISRIKTQMRDKEAQPEGILRVAFPTSIDQAILKCFHALTTQFPKIKLELEDVSSFDDIFDGRVDINIGNININDSRLIKALLIKLERGIYASPHYVEEHGKPKTVKDLMQHNCLVNRHFSSKNEWIFEKSNPIPVKCNLASRNQVNLIDATLLGVGICWSNKTVMKPSVDSGKLIEITLDKKIESGELHIYHLPSYRGALVQVASEFIQNYFKKH